MPEPIPADRNFTDLVLSINGEKMAQRERAEAAEARVAELEAKLAELRSAEADAPR